MEPKKYKKENIPKSLKKEIWLSNFGKVYSHKCYITWCSNDINVFDFHAGHDTPESKGGSLELKNLKPICSVCNTSMGAKYTIKEYIQVGGVNKRLSMVKRFAMWLARL